mgnify:CR=1 FL=1
MAEQTVSAKPKGPKPVGDTEKAVGRILEIEPNTSLWEVTDVLGVECGDGAGDVETLAMSHCKVDQAGPRGYPWMNGIVTNLSTGRVFASCMGYPMQVVSDRVTPGDEGFSTERPRSIVLEDGLGYKFEPLGRTMAGNTILPHDMGVLTAPDGKSVTLETTFKVSREGVGLRVALAGGRMLIMGNRKLDVESSCWGGGSKTFKLMWEETGGPSAEELYGSAMESPRVYYFVLLNPALRKIGREDYGTGKIMLMGQESMWGLEDSPYNLVTVGGEMLTDRDESKKTVVVDPDFEPNWSGLNVEVAESITLEEANAVLAGTYPSNETEANIFAHSDASPVFCVLTDPETGRYYGSVTITSPVVAKRAEAREMILKNLTWSFVRIIGLVMSRERRLSELLPPLRVHDPQEISDEVDATGRFIYVDGEPTPEPGTVRELADYVFTGLMMALPHQVHEEFSSVHAKFVRDYPQVVSWLQSFALAREFPEKLPVVKVIADKAKATATRTKAGRRGNFTSMVREDIAERFAAEGPTNLYKIMNYWTRKVRSAA